MKRYLKFIIVPMVALFVFSGIRLSTQTAQYTAYNPAEHSTFERLSQWLSGHAPQYVYIAPPKMPKIEIGQQQACAAAQDTSGPSLFGNGVANGCATPLTMSSGLAIATVPCAVNYHACQAVYQAAAGVTPVANGTAMMPLSCYPTSVTTQVATQSVPTTTVGEFVVLAPSAIVSGTVVVNPIY